MCVFRLPLFALTTMLAACSGGNLASNLLATPDLKVKGQSKCKVAKSQSRPLIVEWPSADRGALEVQMKKGLVVVRYTGCEMEILRHCSAPSNEYTYHAMTRKRDRVTMRDADDLYANIPLGAAKFEAKLARAGELTVTMTMVGSYEAPHAELRVDQLEGDCDGASHMVTALTAGAFSFFAGADAAVGGGVGTVVGGAKAGSSAKREVLNEDGDEEACEKATSDDTGPPDQCGALLRLEVAELLPAKAPPPAPTGTQTPPPGGSTAKPVPRPTHDPPKPLPPGPGIAVINRSGKAIRAVQFQNCNQIGFTDLPNSYIPPRESYRTPKVTGCVWLRAVFSSGGSRQAQFSKGRGEFIVK